MVQVITRLCALVRDDNGQDLIEDNGQDLIEYALIASLIAIVAIVSIGNAGTEVSRLWTNIAAGLQDIP